MATLVMNYTVNPIWNGLRSLVRGMIRSQTRMGYIRAAAALANNGHYAESKRVMEALAEFDKTNK